MKILRQNNQFKKNLKLCAKRNYDFSKLAEVLHCLSDEESLPARCKPHMLSGDWAGHWECHIAADWLLIWLDDGDDIYLVATGTHADLF